MSVRATQRIQNVKIYPTKESTYALQRVVQDVESVADWQKICEVLRQLMDRVASQAD